MRYLLLFITLIAAPLAGFAQRQVRISGQTYSKENGKPLAYVNILKQTGRKNSSDSTGVFNWQCNAGDTVIFSHIGFKPVRVVVPDTAAKAVFYKIRLEHDPLVTGEVHIKSMPSNSDAFKRAVMRLDIQDKQAQQAEANTEKIDAQADYGTTVEMTADENFRAAVNPVQPVNFATFSLSGKPVNKGLAPALKRVNKQKKAAKAPVKK